MERSMQTGRGRTREKWRQHKACFRKYYSKEQPIRPGTVPSDDLAEMLRQVEDK